MSKNVLAILWAICEYLHLVLIDRFLVHSGQPLED